MSVTNLINEIRAAEAVGDDPRRNSAVYALRLLYGVSFGEPYANFVLYRPTDSDRANAAACVVTLEVKK